MTAVMASHTTPGPRGTVLFDIVSGTDCKGIALDLWYSNRHIPALQRGHRKGALRRYAAPARSSYLCVVELDTEPATFPAARGHDAPPAALAEHLRFIGRALGSQQRMDHDERSVDAPIVYPVFFRVPAAEVAEFNRWYDTEHVPMLLANRHWVMCRRFALEAAQPPPWTHVALHYLTDLMALQSAERDAARSTPWRQKLEAGGWFVPENRIYYRTHAFAEHTPAKSLANGVPIHDLVNAPKQCPI